jgi:NADH-quinone oxidoreductase subunit E
MSSYAPPPPARRLDGASYVLFRREDTSLDSRVSSLAAAMTPESIQAAVQQAGTGLEPIRVGVPQTTPDDLTVISGIDAARQRELNSLGIFYYWQVAGWSPENVAWVSNRILSPERVARENWMSQAAGRFKRYLQFQQGKPLRHQLENHRPVFQLAAQA